MSTSLACQYQNYSSLPETVALCLETTWVCPCTTVTNLGAGKRGLKKGLQQYPRLVILFMDETIVTSTPPLRATWALQGTQAVVPIIGDHRRRILSGTMSRRGGLLVHDTLECHQEEFHLHVRMIRSLWRGWNLVLFLDRSSAHTAEASVLLAEELRIALRWFPVACPKLNPMDHLWRHIKGDV